ncbi:hypothetical protein [Algoriphagus sp. A40]|uniref:hypothetical protein n=1 Tax=Algoriphagus sp. A40 TaxID=1945863 RepID=UPI0009878FA2|nr:hypothetical protein [Algoriphagus sp. A40]OOG71897.1 hypothetical protein B0E43_16575 [Algoriphagus sp. A40]
MKRFLAIALCLVSCQVDSGHLSEANDYFVEYLLTHEIAYLDSSYQYLRSEGYLNGEKLDHQNIDLITSVLLYTKKYDELEGLLKADNKLEGYKKDFTLNLTLALKTYKEDSVESRGYILANLKMVKNEIASNPHDSVLWVNYFATRIYLDGKEQTIQEVDSLKSISKTFSDSFYENTLIDFIEEYPKELMFDKIEY